MRKIVLMCVAACLLAGCHMNGRQSDGKEADGMDKNGELTESFDPKADSLAVCGWVKSVYKDVFDAYLRHINDIEIPSASVFDKKYFSEDYLQLDSLISAIDSKETGMVGFRDADHWIQGQDWCEDLACKIDHVRNDPTAATVYLTITNCNGQRPVCLELKKEGKEQWSITDMLTKSDSDEWVSEREQMQKYIDEMGEKAGE